MDSTVFLLSHGLEMPNGISFFCILHLSNLKKGAVPKVWGSLNYFKFTSEFKSAKI